MKYSRKTKMHVSLLFTREYTFESMYVCAVYDRPQFMLYSCAYALGAAVAENTYECVCAQIDLGTDVNSRIDENMVYLPEYLYGSTHLEVAIQSSSTVIIQVLLEAGAAVTWRCLKMIIRNVRDADITFTVLRYVNRDRHLPPGALEKAVSESANVVQCLLDAGHIISMKVFALMVSRECAPETTNIILEHINT